MRSILAVLFVIVFFLIGFVYLGIEWILHKINPYKSDMRQLRVVQWAFRCVLFISGVKLEVHGEENVPKDETVLYIGNHRSIFDVIITYARCPRLTGYISKRSINKVPFLRIFMKRLHCLFLDRDDKKEGLRIILEAIDHIKNGISICVFPEGTRNKNSDDPTSILEFKEGTFKIASKTGCPIVPMAMTHTNEILEDHMPWIKRTKVILTYGTPVNPKDLSLEDQKKMGAYFQKEIQNMLIEQSKKS